MCIIVTVKTSVANKYEKIVLSSNIIGTKIGILLNLPICYASGPSLVPVPVKNLLAMLFKETAVQLYSKNLSLSRLATPQIEKGLLVLHKIQAVLDTNEYTSYTSGTHGSRHTRPSSSCEVF